MSNIVVASRVSKALVTLICCATLSACSGIIEKKRNRTADAFKDVKTIQVTDNTNPLLLTSTDAGNVREFVEIALKHLGYQVCRNCQHDAEAVVTVHVYQTSNKRDLLWMGHRVLSKSEWSIVIKQNDTKIFSRNVQHEKPEAINHLSARQVQNVLRDISP